MLTGMIGCGSSRYARLIHGCRSLKARGKPLRFWRGKVRPARLGRLSSLFRLIAWRERTGKSIQSFRLFWFQRL
jgi:hypothetical protein